MSSTMASDKLVKEMLSHLDSPMPLVDREADSRVASFYSQRSVFITGATGFIGKSLAEKLVRSCGDVKRIYVLVREKRGKTVQERLMDLIKSQCFNRIRELNKGSNSMLEEKLYAIKGDITLPKFGISPEDMKLLSDNVSIVFNSAATIRFVEPIEIAVKNNIYSVGQLIDFCDELHHLEAVVHLSTAYSNCHKRDTIHEIFYEPPMNAGLILETMGKLQSIESQLYEYREDQAPERDGKPSRGACKLQLFYPDRAKSLKARDELKKSGSSAARSEDNSERQLLKSFSELALERSNRPNTYTFTKAISENYLLDKVRARPDRYLGDKIPVAIVRPSIVGGSWREPAVGMVDNFNGPTGAILSLYTGGLQVMSGRGERVADIVPVDMVTNMVLSTAWFLLEQKAPSSGGGGCVTALKEIQPDHGVFLFNFVSGCRNPMRWHVLLDHIAQLAYKFPSKFTTRLPSSYFLPAGRLYDLYDLLNQKLPAFLADLVRGKLLAQQLDRKSSALVAHSNIRKMADMLTPFTSTQWKFSDNNVRHLYDSLSASDKSVFHFDVGSISWAKYMNSYIIGSRIYTLRDEPKNVNAGLALVRRRRLINTAAVLLLVVMLLYLFLVR